MGAQAGGVWGQEAEVSLPAAWWVLVLIATFLTVLLSLYACVYASYLQLHTLGLMTCLYCSWTKVAWSVSVDIQR